MISRGTTITELKNEAKWWHGPEWLNKLDSEWTVQPLYFNQNLLELGKITEIQKEEKIIHFIRNHEENELERGKWYKFKLNRQEVFPLIEAYGDWKTLLNVTVAVF